LLKIYDLHSQWIFSTKNTTFILFSKEWLVVLVVVSFAWF